MREEEMVRWHHRLNGHEFEQALGVGDGQGSLVCCSPGGRKVLDTTERLIWLNGAHHPHCTHSPQENPGSCMRSWWLRV